MSFDLADFYDAELRRLHAHFGAALDIGRGDCVLDIGCGAGLTTREAARAAPEGQVLGIDVSESLLRAARERTVAERLYNVDYACGDAQTHDFGPARFDHAISRFGTMFFADAKAAFANIASALRPGARLVAMVWRERELNAWSVEIPRALGMATSASKTASAFSQADDSATSRLLRSAGFESVSFADVGERVFYGKTVDAAYEVVAALFDSGHVLAGNDERAREARERVRAMLGRHLTAAGVEFDARAWLITARRA